VLLMAAVGFFFVFDNPNPVDNIDVVVWILPALWLIRASGRSVRNVLNLANWRSALAWGLAIGLVIALTDVVPRALETLRHASAILDAKAPAEAPVFKAWLNSIAAKVADASKEGGFLGFGGVKVSEAEKATLAEIAAALGTSAQA